MEWMTILVGCDLSTSKLQLVMTLEAKAKAKAWTLKAKAKAWTFKAKAKAKAKASTLKAKAKAKDTKFVLEDPRGQGLASRTTSLKISEKILSTNTQH